MTKYINQNEVPKTIKDSITKDLANLVSQNKNVDNISLQYIDNTTNLVYIFFLIKNNSSNFEELFFVSNDIIMDYRIPVKSLASQAF